jgi:hypothetical protein
MEVDTDQARKKLTQKRQDAALVRRDDELAIAKAEADAKRATLKATAPVDLVGSIEMKSAELDADAARLAVERARNAADQHHKADDIAIQTLADHIDYASHRVQQLQDNIAKMAIRAPRAGTVVYAVTPWDPEKIKVGDSAWRGRVVLQIVGLGAMIGHGHVDEVGSARVADHQPVSLRLDALPDVELRGTIAKIAPNVHPKSPSDPSKIVDVEIEIDRAAAALRPNMRFRGQVEIARVTHVIQIPAEAVFIASEGPIAYVERSGHLERTRLVLGQRSATAIEVKSGLREGDRVSRREP